MSEAQPADIPSPVTPRDEAEAKRDMDLVRSEKDKAKKEAAKIRGTEEELLSTADIVESKIPKRFRFLRHLLPRGFAEIADHFKTDDDKRACLEMHHMATNQLELADPLMPRYCHMQMVQMRHAAAYLDDAFKGRLENGFGKAFTAPIPAWLAFQIHASTWYTNLLKLVSLVFCWITVFFEPLSYADESNNLTQPLQIFELLCIALFTSDLLLRSVYMGPKKMMDKNPLRVLISVVAISWLDIIIALAVPRRWFALRFSRVFRPLIFLIRDKTSMQLLKTILKIVPRLAPLFVLLLALVFGFALIGMQLCTADLWRQSLDEGIVEPDPSPFHDFVQASISLTTLLTVESYNDVVTPFVRNKPWLMGYFVSFLCCGVLVLLNMVIAVQVDVFTVLHKEQVTVAIRKQRKTLLVVYHLAVGRTGTISKNRWRALVRVANPKLPVEVVDQLFAQCDTDNSNSIDEYEFLRLCDLLRVEFYVQSLKLPTRFQLWLKRVLRHWTYLPFQTCCCLINIALAACLTSHSPSPLVFAVVVADVVFIVIFLVDILMRILSTNLNTFLRSWGNRTLFGLLIMSLLTALVSFILKDWSKPMSAADFRLMWISAALRFFRVPALPLNIQLSAKTREQLELLWQVKDPLIDFFTLMSVLLYMFLVLGLELFHGTSRFLTLKDGILTVLQLSNQEDWPNIMRDTIDSVGSRWPALYFVFFVFLVDIMVLNLLMAVMYSLASQRKDETSGKSKDSSGKDKDKDKDKKSAPEKPRTPTEGTESDASRSSVQLRKSKVNWRIRMVENDGQVEPDDVPTLKKVAMTLVSVKKAADTFRGLTDAPAAAAPPATPLESSSSSNATKTEMPKPPTQTATASSLWKRARQAGYARLSEESPSSPSVGAVEMTTPKPSGDQPLSSEAELLRSRLPLLNLRAWQDNDAESVTSTDAPSSRGRIEDMGSSGFFSVVSNNSDVTSDGVGGSELALGVNEGEEVAADSNDKTSATSVITSSSIISSSSSDSGVDHGVVSLTTSVETDQSTSTTSGELVSVDPIPTAVNPPVAVVNPPVPETLVIEPSTEPITEPSESIILDPSSTSVGPDTIAMVDEATQVETATSPSPVSDAMDSSTTTE